MIDLQKASGLPIELKDDLRIKFDAPLSDIEPTYVRMFSQVHEVLKNQSFVPTTQEMYLGYRRLALPQDQALVDSNHLEYDLTIIPPMMLGNEYIKTVGHYHANIPGTQIAHSELYEVIAGQALFLIQKMDPEFKQVLDVIAIEAKAGDKIIYPPNYGHIMINLGSDVLVTANWLSTDYKPMYEEVANFHGMAYYVVKNSDGNYAFEKNPNYANHPQVKIVDNQQKVYADFGFKPDEPMYVTGIKRPELLEFLNSPQKYESKLANLTN